MAKEYRGPGCCYRFLRKIVIITQLIYLVLGGLVVGLGLYAMSGYSAVVAGTSIIYGVVVLGAFISAVALIGALSAWRSFRFGLLLNLVCLSLFMIVLISLGIAVYIKRNDAEELIAKGWSSLDVDTRTSIQNEFVCCGSYGPTNATAPDEFGGPCPNVTVDGITGNTTEEGCVPLLAQKLRENFNSAALAGIIVAVSLLFGVVSVSMLRSSIAADAETREELRFEREREAREERRADERARLRERTNDRIGDIRAKYQGSGSSSSSSAASSSSSALSMAASSKSSSSSNNNNGERSSSRDYSSMRSTPSRSAASSHEPDIEAPPRSSSSSNSSSSSSHGRTREPPVRTSRSRGAASDTYRLLD